MKDFEEKNWRNSILSASIVTYNNVNIVGKLLDELLTVPMLRTKDIHVIDNASSDGTQAMLKENFSKLSLYLLDKNLGYGRGHNMALPHIDSLYHMVINPDILVTPSAIESMYAYMENNKTVVALSPRVFFPEGEEQFLPKELPSIRYLLGGQFEKLGRPFKTWRDSYTWRHKSVASPSPISFATGCFMFLNTAMYKRVGGFDPRYFLYMEDVDISRKLSEMGLVIYHPEISVMHHWSRESSRNLKGALLHISSASKYFLKWGFKW